MNSKATSPPSVTDYDVIVIGGAFSGASTALLLRRAMPECRVLVVETSERFGHKVGEATVELSSLFLHRALGLYDHLSREHLPKHGLRFWFADRKESTLYEMSEVGPGAAPGLPSFQLDRSKLDEHLLQRASEEGAEVARPARVTSFDLGWPQSRVRILSEGEPERTVTTRWLVDASGRSAVIARRLRLLERHPKHPIAASWGRWRGVRDLDGPGVLGEDPCNPRLPDIAASRRLATNHFCGRGWWAWMIPLSNGKTSIGVVWNKDLFSLPGEGTTRQRYEAFVRSRPGLRELVGDATFDDGDGMSYSHVPYRAHRFIDRGWALVGDAAAFLDPFYSPGLDHASITVWRTTRLLEDELAGRLDPGTLERELSDHNATLAGSYRNLSEALYEGKYELLGDAELTACAFLIDTASYYLGVVTPAYRDLSTLRNPVLGPDFVAGRIAHRCLRFFNRRLQRLAEVRRERGLYGRRNRGWTLLIRPFETGPAGLRSLSSGLFLWLRIELTTLLRLGADPMSSEVTEAGREEAPAID